MLHNASAIIHLHPFSDFEDETSDKRINTALSLWTCCVSRSQWPRGLRRGSAATSLLKLWVQIPPGALISVCCECCVCQVEVPATSSSLVRRSPTECGVSECDGETSTMRRPWPPGGCWGMKKVLCEKKTYKVLTNIKFTGEK